MSASKNNLVRKVVEAGQGGTLVEVGGKLIDALELIELMNYRMMAASAALASLADRDWDGKWRINKAIANLSMHDEELAKQFMEANLSQGVPK